MAAGLTPHLAGVFALAFVAALAIVRRHAPLPVAAAVALVRVAIPLLYFAVLQDGTWGILDDQTYFDQARRLLDSGYTPASAVTSTDGLAMLFGLSGGIHIGFLWWNLLVTWLLGAHYYVPIAVNVVLSLLIADCTTRLAARAGFDAVYRRALFVFLALHWDLVAWSSFLDIKDVLVALIEVLLLLRLSAFGRARTAGARTGSVAVIALLGIALFFIRFYVPVLLAAAAVLAVVLADAQLRRRLSVVLVLAAPGLALVVLRMLPGLQQFAVPGQLPTGLVRAMLSPQPWSVAEDHGFLLLPAWLHLLFAPLLALGLWRLWRDATEARVVILLVVVAVAFYGLVPELQGPRQRFQLGFAIAWAQFHGLVTALDALRTRRLADAVGVAGA